MRSALEILDWNGCGITLLVIRLIRWLVLLFSEYIAQCAHNSANNRPNICFLENP
jgi:hypothetical protein